MPEPHPARKTRKGATANAGAHLGSRSVGPTGAETATRKIRIVIRNLRGGVRDNEGPGIYIPESAVGVRNLCCGAMFFRSILILTQ